ncbi:metallophosphoesterase [Deinococcus sp.]|uniref:metallophosphoesterase family protein n=1 Tax=Deinococcus sp. TaxID=47478 RepID=UPI0025EE7125|nr:metallophosphoesterase [Deinococcus sp.]
MPPVRLAFIADIHGNQDALAAVLADIQLQGAERLYVNGDVVNRGPDSVQAMDTLLNLKTAPLFTLGNHDDLMRLWLSRDETLPGDWFDDPFWAATAWSAAKLEQAGHIGTIMSWPMTQRLNIGGPGTGGLGVGGLGDIEVAHGSHAYYRESLGASTPPTRLDELLSEAGACVLVGSHTHRPMIQPLPGGRLVLNTGAVGAPFNDDPRAQYLLLGIETGPDGLPQWQPSIRTVPYDRSGVLRRFETSGLIAQGGVSAEIFREEVRQARSFYTPYWMWTEETGKPRTPETWGHFKTEFPERFV